MISDPEWPVDLTSTEMIGEEESAPWTDGATFGTAYGLDYEKTYTLVVKFQLIDAWAWEPVYTKEATSEYVFTTLNEAESIATAIAGLKTATVKADGKYLEDGRIVIVKDGKRYGVTGIRRK